MIGGMIPIVLTIILHIQNSCYSINLFVRHSAGLEDKLLCFFLLVFDFF